VESARAAGSWYTSRMPKRGVADAASYLVAAYETKDVERKLKLAYAGLASSRLEPDTQQLLLRQVYLAELERQQFETAALCAEQMVQVGNLSAVAHADAARAYAAAGNLAKAVLHQRLAARLAPGSLRSVQYARLSRLLRLNQQRSQARLALRHAHVWATWDRALVRAEIALLEVESGLKVNAAAAYEALEQSFVPVALSYYVAAELALVLGEEAVARRLFNEFVGRCAALPLVERVSLLAESRRARSLHAPLPRLVSTESGPH
jgi:hypothetical protein